MLEELLDPSGSFTTHLQAGNFVFSPTPDDVADLVAFLRTIDDQIPIISVPADQRFCPYKMGMEHVGFVVGEDAAEFSRTHREVLAGQQFQSSTNEPYYILFEDLPM